MLEMLNGKVKNPGTVVAKPRFSPKNYPNLLFHAFYIDYVDTN